MLLSSVRGGASAAGVQVGCSAAGVQGSHVCGQAEHSPTLLLKLREYLGKKQLSVAFFKKTSMNHFRCFQFDCSSLEQTLAAWNIWIFTVTLRWIRWRIQRMEAIRTSCCARWSAAVSPAECRWENLCPVNRKPVCEYAAEETFWFQQHRCESSEYVLKVERSKNDPSVTTLNKFSLFVNTVRTQSEHSRNTVRTQSEHN